MGRYRKWKEDQCKDIISTKLSHCVFQYYAYKYYTRSYIILVAFSNNVTYMKNNSERTNISSTAYTDIYTNTFFPLWTFFYYHYYFFFLLFKMVVNNNKCSSGKHRTGIRTLRRRPLSAEITDRHDYTSDESPIRDTDLKCCERNEWFIDFQIAKY